MGTHRIFSSSCTVHHFTSSQDVPEDMANRRFSTKST